MHDRAGIQQGPRPQASTLRRAAMVSGIVLATAATIAWTLCIRVHSEYPPIPRSSLVSFRFDAYEFGVVFQELAIPLALIALYSATGGFRRIVSGESTAGDRLQLYGVLAAAQAVTVGYTLFVDEMATGGLWQRHVDRS
jgi:hypothetical protein